ncbi:helix-turn-helix domain-containing protein [Paenibacillus harenae]|uniref:helix-turn-helix domain-containing protein n=1 Tax=Paenibacillus harenae TaxID=306543 RepID=UPI00040E82B4|nr:AraC family transcriptional regulator [Paenibacillus harenae]
MRLHIEYEHEIPINAFIWIPDSEKTPLHYHASLEIGCCISGEGEFYFGSKKYSVGQGDIFIVNHTEMHIACSAEHNPSTYLFLNFDPSLLLAEDERLLLPFSIPAERFQNLIPAASDLAKVLLPLMEGIWSELGNKQEGYPMIAKGLLLQICAYLLRYYSASIDPAAWRQLTDSFSKFRLISAYMEENFHEPLELKQIAQVLQLSPSRVSRLFQEVLGRGFKDYLLLLRLAEARRLLVRTNMSVTEVCFASGFQSVSTFYRLFAGAEGISPTGYRNKYAGIAIFENEPL